MSTTNVSSKIDETSGGGLFCWFNIWKKFTTIWYSGGHVIDTKVYRLTEALLRFHLECHEIGLYNEKCVCGG